MIYHYTISQAKESLEELIAKAREGEAIMIDVEDTVSVRLVPGTSLRKPGSAAGEIWMSDDFDAPLEEFEEYM
jgi:antitoxin (DNA-binding transcriptional repressor) of toxin-antitoxin stability system